MNTVRKILEHKGTDIWHTSPDTSVFEALRLMAEKNVGALLVLEGEDLVGVFSERDYARKIVLLGRVSKETPVSRVMSENPVCVGPAQSVGECMAIMTERHIRHLPVMEEDRLVGIISIGDVVRDIIADQSATIGYLKDFIKRG